MALLRFSSSSENIVVFRLYIYVDVGGFFSGVRMGRLFRQRVDTMILAIITATDFEANAVCRSLSHIRNF